MQQESATRTRPAAIAAALAAAETNGIRADGGVVRFPGEDRGQSLGEMAQRDLDAALQLLADRAQYITGSSGAAIALRRGGKNDMLCRASSGSNAPELGALLSTEFGLSGESVRTRQLLRCDDAERDARVNREACQELGIASVAVMPVVHDDEVLGVFELFSGKAHAFGDRDFAALRRLSEMVETAVKLARAAEELPGRLQGEVQGPEVDEDEDILETADAVVVAEDVSLELPSGLELPEKSIAAAAGQGAVIPSLPSGEAALSTAPPAAPQEPAVLPATAVSGNRRLLWSLAQEARGDQTSGGSDQSHVPAMMRNLKKCEACGFPVSAGRMLCVECEEKKWRGQLKAPKSPRPDAAGATETQRPDQTGLPDSRERLSPQVPSLSLSAAAVAKIDPAAVSEAMKEPETGELAVEVATTAVAETSAAPNRGTPSPELILSAGLEPSQSWFGANRFIIIAILVVGAAAAALALLH